MTRFHGPDDPVYTISVAARLLGVNAQTLRQIESEGLATPKRTESNIRLYSDNDLRLLAKIIFLWKDCGINPQGIRVIIAMEEGDRTSAVEGYSDAIVKLRDRLAGDRPDRGVSFTKDRTGGDATGNLDKDEFVKKN
jgi:MerR family transcriptional regulator/heat shock protein HspR